MVSELQEQVRELEQQSRQRPPRVGEVKRGTRHRWSTQGSGRVKGITIEGRLVSQHEQLAGMGHADRPSNLQALQMVNVDAE